MTTSNSDIQQYFKRVKENKLFETFIISIIIFSALIIGVKTHQVPATVVSVIQYLDVAITLIFLVEIAVRFIGTENRRRFFHNGWNVFDTLIVTVSLIPIEDSELAYIGRLIRIFRVLRMVSIVPELRMLLNSLLKALPQLGYVVTLMFIIFYIYAAIGTTLFSGINSVLWGDISISMLTLFRVMTFEDWTDVMYETMIVYPMSWTYFLSFIFFTAFAFLNMVIGIVVNVINEEHELERKMGHPNEPTMEDLQDQLNEIKLLIVQQRAEERG
ncbi:MAG: ion transporter [Gammaproteobacteria bacterium]|nr:ion transporter [Gammaproteobacteria bacterium]